MAAKNGKLHCLICLLQKKHFFDLIKANKDVSKLKETWMPLILPFVFLSSLTLRVSEGLSVCATLIPNPAEFSHLLLEESELHFTSKSLTRTSHISRAASAWHLPVLRGPWGRVGRHGLLAVGVAARPWRRLQGKKGIWRYGRLIGERRKGVDRSAFQERKWDDYQSTVALPTQTFLPANVSEIRDSCLTGGGTCRRHRYSLDGLSPPVIMLSK